MSKQRRQNSQKHSTEANQPQRNTEQGTTIIAKNIQPLERRIVQFAWVYAVALIIAFILPSVGFVKEHIISPLATVQAYLGSFVAPLFTSELVELNGTVISSRFFAIDVSYGCDGLDAVLLALSGVVALPGISLLHRAIGFVAVGGVVFISNMMRLMLLWYIGLNHPEQFDLFHREILPLVMAVVALFIFAVWAWLATASVRSSSSKEENYAAIA